MVFDSPVLLYYAANEGKGRVHMVGTPFRKEDYGIIFPPGNPLRRQVNVTLLQLARGRHLPADLRQVVRQPIAAPRQSLRVHIDMSE